MPQHLWCLVNWLLDIPATFKILGSLGMLLALNAWGRHLSVSLLAGTVLLAVWCEHPLPAIARIALERAGSVDHLLLLAVTFQVIWLSSQMAKAGVMNDLVAAVRSKVPRRAAIAVLPAMIGLLPMPGGALFSAPLVDDCDEERTLSGLLKTRINYWFRHIWEYWWPLYPGVLLALAITGLDVWEVILIHLPITLFSIAGGTAFLLRQVPHLDEQPTASRTEPVASLLVLTSPILTVITVYAIVRLGFPSLANFNRYVPMILGLMAAALVQQVQRPLRFQQWKEVILSRKTLVLVVLVTLVRVYGAFIEAPTGSGLTPVEHMNADLTSWGIPMWAVAVLLPFIAGMATGLAIGFVGASFPIVVSLVGQDPAPAQLYPAVILGYAFGHMGMMLSPVHICLVVTNEHFKTNLVHSMAGLIKPALTVLAGAVLLAWAVGSLL